MKSIYIAGVVIIVGLLLISILPGPPPQIQRDELKKFASYEELQEFIKSRVDESYFYDSIGIRSAAALESASAPTASGADKAAYSSTNVQVAGVDEPDFVKTDGRYIYVISGNEVVIAHAYPAENAKIVSEIKLVNSSIRDMFINGDRLVVFGDEYSNDGYILQEKIAIWPPIYASQSSFIKVYNIADRENPILVRSIKADGYYFSSRMVGHYVYAVINQPIYNYDVVPLPRVLPAQSAFPDIYYFDIPDRSYNYVNIIAINTQDDSEDYTNKVFMLPSSENIFVSEKNIYITYVKWFDHAHFFDQLVDEVIIPSIPQLEGRIRTIRGLDISNASKYVEIQAIVGDYMQKLSLEEQAALARSMEARMQNFQEKIAKEQQKTVINKISFSGSEINYAAQGAVPGYVLNQFSMDEHDGYFRIATTVNAFGFVQPLAVRGIATDTGVVSSTPAVSPGGSGGASPASPPEGEFIAPPILPPRTPDSFNNLYVLDSQMNVVGKVEDLAPGERIFATRFAGNRAYVVTFRQVDPLFVIDLSNPANPRVLGQLKITGVSNYLHPLDDSHIIGIGKDATDEGMLRGLKMSLFDVSDVSNPVEVSKILIGDRGTESEVLYDHKAFLFDVEKNLLVLPIMLAEIDPAKYGKPLPDWAYGEPKWQGAYVFDASRNGFVIRGRIDHATEESKDFQTFYGQYSVRRALYIGDVLYTISGKLIKMNSISDLKEIKTLELPGYEEAILIY